MKISELNIGTTFKLEDKIFSVVEYKYISNPRVATIVQTKLKNIGNGDLIELTFSPNDEVEDVNMTTRDISYSYTENDIVYFVDLETKETISTTKDSVQDILVYCIHDVAFKANYINGVLTSITPPTYLELLVTDLKEANDGADYIPVVTETGLVVRAPKSVTKGNKIKIDTRTGKHHID